MKPISTKYATKMINDKFYGGTMLGDNPNDSEKIKYLTPEEFAAGKQGPILMPYENGTRRKRQVSRWVLFKLWFYGLFHKKVKF